MADEKPPAWQKNGPSPNPGGLSREARAAKRALGEAIRSRFTPDGINLVVEALAEGVTERDPACIKLALEYGWGKPEQIHQIENAAEDGTAIGIRVVFERPSNGSA